MVPPKVLFVVSPHGQQKCAGEFALVKGETVNGQPLWKQCGGNFWFYCGLNGMWIIGGSEVKGKDFQCSKGSIFCQVLHSGATPDKVKGTWWRLSGDKFVEDEGIRVTTGVSPPASLRVVTPNGQQKSAGEYQLVPGQMAHGAPVWRHRAGKTWLYTGDNGMWVISGNEAKESNFKCSKGVMYSKYAHGGRMPDRVDCAWLRLAGDKFQEDSSITVAIKPSTLYVQSPNGQQRCGGEYVPVADKLVNGSPLWEHIGGKCWLYSGSNGMWIIGGADAKAKDFNCTRGVIYCREAHHGKMPDTMVGNWLRLEGDAFRDDCAISVSVKPSMLYVVSPNGQQRCAGEYRLVVGESAYGQPVWKHRRAAFRIASNAEGAWRVAGVEAGTEGGDYKTAPATLQCGLPHQGAMPDKVGAEWSRSDGTELIKDSDVAISTVLHKPAKLHVKSPNGQQRCAGEYVLVANTQANGHPIWRQMGGKYWLYSGTNGMWIFGSSGAKEKGFDCSRGVIYSNTPHGGVMPDKLRSLWLRLEGEAFHEDAAIIVESDNRAGVRKRPAPAAADASQPKKKAAA